MQSNTARVVPQVRTAEGALAYPHIKPIQALRRSVLACLLFEREFYEDGQTIADRIEQIVLDASKSGSIHADIINALAIEARSEHNLRHVPLLLCVALAKAGGLQANTLEKVIQRADELSEFLALYWARNPKKNGKRAPLSKQVKRGLANAFRKFDAYQLAKYDRDGKDVRLRDVLFMVHAKPKDEAQAAIWKQLVDGTLPTPDTWETNLSAGKDKRESFERLLRENLLGYLAVLRNLRNMSEAGVDDTLIRDAILDRKGAERVLPFRYVAAARACPRLEPFIDQALCESIAGSPALPGKTVVLVDVSGSMDAKLSEKSDLTRMDAACALAALIHGDIRMFSFSNQVVEVPPRRGMAGIDALVRSQMHAGTALFQAVQAINQKVPYDRLIVITDEQAGVFGSLSAYHGQMPDPKGKGYVINVASNKNGVGYGKWLHIDGFSESVLRWIAATEAEGGQ